MKDKLNSHGLFGEDETDSPSTLSVRSNKHNQSSVLDAEANQTLRTGERGVGDTSSAPSSSGRESTSSKKERNLFKEDGGEKEKTKPAETENVRIVLLF
jgi:hypothetical protein